MTRRLLCSVLAAMPFFRPAKASSVKPLYLFTLYEQGGSFRIDVWSEKLWDLLSPQWRRRVRLASFSARIEGNDQPRHQACVNVETKAWAFLVARHPASTGRGFSHRFKQPEEAFGKERA